MQPLKSFGGNLEMVEKNVEELDNINRSAVSKIPGLPDYGTVDMKAFITMDGETPNIRIERKRIDILNSSGTTRNDGSSDKKGVDISASPVSGTIEFTEENGSTIKNRSGGENVRQNR